MPELFTDDDPDYRETRVDSGIPPPSISTIPHFDERGPPRGTTRGQPDPLMSYNPKRQRNDGPYQQQGEPYQRHNEGYPRHERQRDSYGRGDQRREPYQRPDERSHRFEHDRHHGSDRRDEPYHRPDQQYRPREDPYHRDERHPSDRRDDWHHRDERYPSDRRDEPYHRDERHPSDRRDDSYHRSEQQHRPREEQYERHGYPSHDDPHRRSEQHYRPRDEHQPREDSHRQDTKHPELSSQVLPPPAKAIEVDFKMNTDFLVCGEDDATVKLSTEEEIVKCLKIKFGGIDEPVDYEFVSSADLVQQVNAVKNRLSGTQHEVFTLARSRTNPFDQIDRANFMNRAATKLAVLDVTFNLMSVSDSSQIFRFADLCGGPGGFSEYLLWRAHTSGQRIHGYGITLKGEADKEWRLNNFHPDANVQESFTVIDGQDHTGDICNPENMAAFAAEVRQESPSGVDLVVADGGICFEGKQDKQEQIAQQLLVCQIATMLASLRKGGKFVCKFFDITQEFTAGLVWILYQCFESICITKPLTSRPANAERYIICDKLRFNRPQAIIDYLLSVNQAIKDEQTKRVCGVVELATLKRDESFIDYLKMRNMIFAIKQKEALERVEEFVQQPHNGAMEPDQSQVRRRCLREWRLPLQKEN